MAPPRSRAHGFSLIELMIVVAVIGILTLVAYPSYEQYVRKGKRSAAQSFMLSAASKQEQYLLDKRSYAADKATLGVTQPPETVGFYTIEFQNVSSAGWELAATAIGNQAPDGDLMLTSSGAKTPADKWR